MKVASLYEEEWYSAERSWSLSLVPWIGLKE